MPDSILLIACAGSAAVLFWAAPLIMVKLAKSALKAGLVAASVTFMLRGTPIDPMALKLRGAASAGPSLSVDRLMGRMEKLSGSLPKPKGLEPMTDRMPGTWMFRPIAGQLNQLNSGMVPSGVVRPPKMQLPTLAELRNAPAAVAAQVQSLASSWGIVKRRSP